MSGREEDESEDGGRALGEEEELEELEEEDEDEGHKVEEVVAEEDEEEEEEEEGPDPSQMLEINQDYAEEGVEVKEELVEDGDREASSHRKGLLEMALTMDRPKELQQQQQHVALPQLPIPDFDALDEERRAVNQSINSKPRGLCPICGDRANGIHYGIYTCEGCKNFFKRSVTVLSAGKPYVCKDGQMSCSVSLYESDGVTRRRTRCQYCRYQACVAAGMVYNGRVAVRQNNGAAKLQEQNPLDVSLPLYGAREYNGDAEDEEEEAEVVCPNLLEPSSASLGAVSSSPASVAPSTSLLHKLTVEYLQNEVQRLQSRVRELESSSSEKDRQLELQSAQIENLRRQCGLQRRLDQQQASASASSPSPSKRPRVEHSNGVGDGDVANGEAGNPEKLTFPEGSAVSVLGNGSVTITSLKRQRQLQQQQHP